MPEADDFDDPTLTRPSASVPSFWASIHWRLGLGIAVTVLTGIVFFFLSLLNARHFYDIPALTIGSMVGMAGLWVLCRVLWAWVEWASSSPITRGIKGVIRFCLFDAESERQATGKQTRPTDPAE